jgi:hypothetical protein
MLLAILFGLSAVSACAGGVTFYVDANGPNDPGTGGFEDPFRTIQDAIDAAFDGDVVEIRAGVYAGAGNYNLDPAGKSITVQSIDPNDPNVVAGTVIDAGGLGRGFYFDSSEDVNCLVQGLTIRNGYTAAKGGGVYCLDSSPTIANCVISACHAEMHGGGLFLQLSKSLLTGCKVSGNSAGMDGGAIECWWDGPRLVNCLITDNQAILGSGGGVDCFSEADVRLTNCTIVRNSADGYGGGLYSLASETIIENSIIWANVGANGAQVALKPYFGSLSTVEISHSDIEGGTPAIYDPCNGLAWGIGNLDADPCFVSFDASGDPNIWDFHLQSSYGRWDTNTQSWVTDSNMSACIDAGDPNLDWSDEPWPNGKHINMGAFGRTKSASMNGNPADFDVNWLVDFADFADFSQKWSAEEFCIQDLTIDGTVGWPDLGVFVQNWLWQTQ